MEQSNIELLEKFYRKDWVRWGGGWFTNKHSHHHVNWKANAHLSVGPYLTRRTNTTPILLEPNNECVLLWSLATKPNVGVICMPLEGGHDSAIDGNRLRWWQLVAVLHINSSPYAASRIAIASLKYWHGFGELGGANKTSKQSAPGRNCHGRNSVETLLLAMVRVLCTAVMWTREQPEMVEEGIPESSRHAVSGSAAAAAGGPSDGLVAIVEADFWRFNTVEAI